MVQLHMLHQHFSSNKSEFAQGTTMGWFFARVEPQMLLHIIAFGKAAVAKSAFVWFFTGVNTQVAFETSTRAECKRAPLADVRPSPGVYRRMLSKTRRTPKALPAMLAMIRLLSRMHPFMCHQRKFPGKAFAARITEMWFLPVMHHHVKFELSPSHTLATHFTVHAGRFFLSHRILFFSNFFLLFHTRFRMLLFYLRQRFCFFLLPVIIGVVKFIFYNVRSRSGNF